MIVPLVLSLFLSGSVPDNLCLLRINPSHPKQKLWVYVHRPELGDDVIYGNLQASDLKFGKLKGGKPVRFAFPAQWDGLGQDELIVVREHKQKRDHRLELQVYAMPDRINGNTGGVLASSKQADLGVAVGAGRLVTLGPIDLDGDEIDELALIFEAGDGRQWLEIRRFPRFKKDLMGPPSRSDASFGQAGSDANLAIFGSDVDADGQDELVTLRKTDTGPDRLLVFEPPTQLGGETGLPIRSDLDLTPADGGVNLGMWRLRDQIGGEYQALLLRAAQDGVQRLELLGLPQAVAGDVGAALQTHLNLELGSTRVDLFAAFGARDLGAQPWVDYNGTWTLSLKIAYQDLSGNIITHWIGPYSGFVGTSLPWPGLRLEFPFGTTLGESLVEGAVTGWGTNSSALFGSNVGYSPTIHFYPTSSSDIVAPGDRITITYPTGTISNPTNLLPKVSGLNAFGFTIGEVVAPDNVTLKAVVYEYLFERS